MRRLVYNSVATEHFSEGDLFRIVSQSARKNGDVGLNGFLLYANRRFFQLLEGPAGEVSALYNVIRNDDRHCDCAIVLDEEIKNSAFSKWSMRRIRAVSSEGALAEIAEQANGNLPNGLNSLISEFLNQPAD